MFEYRAVVVGFHDGDTFYLDIDLGCGVWIRKERVRWNGIDAPELSTDAGKAAAAYVEQILPLGTEVIVKTEKDRKEKYGRYLVWLYPPGSDQSWNQHMIDQGHAVAYDGKGPRGVATATEPSPRFDVGDKVKVIASMGIFSNGCVGSIGTIIERAGDLVDVFGVSVHAYSVQFDGDSKPRPRTFYEPEIVRL